MKSLILKDLYNIRHNAKSMLFILVVLAAVFISTSGVEGYVNICAVMCSMMIVTTFAFDDSSKWARYAMITPVSRKDLVAAKFIVLSIFCAIGSLFGLVISVTAGLIMKQVPFGLAEFGELLLLALAAWAISFILGSISIPLVFKFGVEKGRVLLLVSFVVPAGMFFGIYQTLVMLGVDITDRLVFTLLCCSPIAAIVWCYAMYQISYRIFEKQEL
ncbi:MAG: ABC-2 transporter permease [Lachnospiraceae bacterium]|nr:ABC-2 transporter permease [Lachnospiraceae bacterium]